MALADIGGPAPPNGGHGVLAGRAGSGMADPGTGEVSRPPRPVRLGGFWLLLGTAILVMPMISLLGISPGPGTTMMFAAVGIALVLATVWYAVRRD